MKRRKTNSFTRMVFMMTFVVWVLGGGLAFSQTPEGDTPPDPPPTVQEEPMVSEDQDEVIERGIRRGFPRRLPGLLPPKPTAPSAPAPKVFAPSVGGPSTGGTLSQGDRYTAPTPSLTIVANALKLGNKSLTTLISLPPNLPVTQPVEISIGYFSPAGSYAPGTTRITQAYVRETGNHFLNNDPQGDGKPRQMRVHITLRELQPGGQSFAIIWPINLDPLYNVTISSLEFTLLDDCDRVGKSEIDFRWYSPDDQFHSLRFSLHPSQSFHIGAFAWARNEVSVSANLHLPLMFFHERDPGYKFQPDFGTWDKNLVPGKTEVITTKIKEGTDAKGQCYGSVKYTLKYTLRWYPDL